MNRTDLECSFRVTPTNETGIHTGRRRYRVECMRCNVLIHEATTGPLERIEGHLRERDEEFDLAYYDLSKEGACDAPGGAEFDRVKAEWNAAGRPSEIEPFIRRRANVWPGPDGKLPPV